MRGLMPIFLSSYLGQRKILGKSNLGPKIVISLNETSWLIEKFRIDTFIVDTDDLGTLEKVLISNDRTSMKPDWFLDKVSVTTEDGDFYDLPIYSWIDEKYTMAVEKVNVEHRKRSNIEDEEPENLEPLGCNDALGMRSGRINDYQITASTSFNDLHLPYHARINYVYPNSFGGWCPYKESEDEFLQIDLNEMTNITGIATQGLGLVDEWTISYFLKYKSTDDFSFKWYGDGQKKVFGS
ncbi:Neuropilin-2 [Thelohanellus kitauei]|uniref:Neuropilin-2 n=1 Tax=Thelohanellus kitauei TaxID=669202 RepID=A0A0C2IL39_THEKT|nr:Neuropilin-2 [Thelohanellus kitauei]